MTPTYSPRERFAILAFGAIGLIGINTVFVYGLIAQPDALGQALTNPISLAFLVESLLLCGFFAYFLGKWNANRLNAFWFVFLSLMGTMLFALSVVLLWKKKEQDVKN